MASKEADFFNRLFSEMPKQEGTEHDFAQERKQNAARQKPACPETVRLEPVTINGIGGEKLTNQSGKRREDRVILYIHGGGFTTGAAEERREITYDLCETYGFTVYANNYRLAPEHLWPAGFDDTYAFYKGLIGEVNPSTLYLMGESAGGTLVLSVALQAEADGVPQPAGIAAFSACTNQADQLPSHVNNIETDTMLGDAVNSEGQYKAVFGSAHPDRALLTGPVVSPYFGDYRLLPPIFLSASDNEVLLDDSVVLYEKLTKEHHPCMLDIQKDVFHAYPMFPMVPEARETLDRAVSFLDKTSGVKA